MSRIAITLSILGMLGCAGSDPPASTATASLSSLPTYSRLVIFGDSLSDTGRMFARSWGWAPPSPPYWNGRFSNGPIWTEDLAELLGGVPVTNFAEGAATTYSYGKVSWDPTYLFITNLDSEIEAFREADRFAPEDLVLIWVGANDYLTFSWSQDSDVHQAVDHLFAKVDEMVAAGAQHIVLLNLPDLGLTPTAKENDRVAEASHASLLHNQLLEEHRATSPNRAHLRIFDNQAAFDEMLKNAASYGFQDFDTPCYSGTVIWSPFTKPVTSTCDGQFFWDHYHPTARGHQLLAERIADFLTSCYAFRP